MRLGAFVLAADMPETDRLWAAIDTWWEAIEALIVTGTPTPAPRPPTPASSTSSAPARGYRNAHNHCARILLASAARAAA
jgi:transposase